MGNPAVVMPSELKMRKVAELLPYARNARDHSDAQISQLAGSMKEFGFTNPILVSGDDILAGHGRVMAAHLLELSIVPTIDLSHLSPTQRKAYILADNKLAENSSWNLAMLKVELEELKAEGFDLSLTGFGDAELADLLTDVEENGKDPDEIPDVPEEPYSKMGDMFLCGPHRVRCGDSTSLEDWNALMQGEMADIQVCDPPYNVNFSTKLAGSIKNDDMGDKEFYDFLLKFYQCSYAVMKPGAAMYVAHADSEGANFRSALKAGGFKLASCLIWVKNALVMGRGDFHYKHEPILYAWKTGGAHKWWGGRKQTTVQDLGESSPFEKLPDGRYAVRNGDNIMYVDGSAVVEEAPSTLIHVDKPKRSALHPTTKPVELWEKLARFNATAKSLIIDGFGGSGTTMIAADRLGMVARLQEFDPRFVDVICARYYGLTGRVPVHAVTGIEFPRERMDMLLAK